MYMSLKPNKHKRISFNTTTMASLGFIGPPPLKFSSSQIVLVTFSLFDVQVLSKTSIWYFDVTLLVSQQFTRRDLKPIVFLA